MVVLSLANRVNWASMTIKIESQGNVKYDEVLLAGPLGNRYR